MRSNPPFSPCPYEMDDGAYILGALAPAERAEFERHLSACRQCRDSMAQLAVLPGLLGRLDPAVAAPSTTAPPSLLPRVLAAVRAQRTARRRKMLATVAATVIAAAVAAIVGIGIPLANQRESPPSISAVFRPMQVDPGESRVDAQIAIALQPTGTLVTVRCIYHGTTSRTWAIWLVVYPRHEEAESIGSWVAIGGTPIEISAVTHYPAAQIDRIELRSDDATLAWWSP